MVDENGNILDGYNRYKICQELGIKDYPRVIRAGMTENQKFTHARKLNLARRHLNREQWQRLIAEEIKANPQKSDRQIAEDLGVHHTTVGTVRKKLVESGDVANLATSTDTLGREQPRERKPISQPTPPPIKPVSVFNPSKRDADALRDPDIQRRLAENDGMNVAGAIRTHCHQCPPEAAHGPLRRRWVLRHR